MKRYLMILTLLIHVFISYSQVKSVAEIGITVSDMETSVRFYTEILGFEKVSDEEYKGEFYEKLQGVFGINTRVVRLKLGEEIIALTDYLTAGGRAIPEDAKSNDLFFQHMAIVVSDMDKAYRLLKENNVVHVSTEPQTIPFTNTAAAGIRAFYFHDPDRHNLELIYFPPGKGLDKWQHSNGKLFLGIDHTAIGVSQTEKSLSFYETILGFTKMGESWNSGSEQSHLNFVENASLHITGLRAAKGPGIEFLEYLEPGPGRFYPDDSRSDDIWHWQITLYVENAEILFKRLINQYRLVSKGIVYRESGNGKLVASFIIRDPDGHALLLIEE